MLSIWVISLQTGRVLRMFHPSACWDWMGQTLVWVAKKKKKKGKAGAGSQSCKAFGWGDGIQQCWWQPSFSGCLHTTNSLGTSLTCGEVRLSDLSGRSLRLFQIPSATHRHCQAARAQGGRPAHSNYKGRSFGRDKPAPVLHLCRDKSAKDHFRDHLGKVGDLGEIALWHLQGMQGQQLWAKRVQVTPGFSAPCWQGSRAELSG